MTVIFLFSVLSLTLGLAQGQCGGNLTDATGNFSNPEFKANTNCIWYIIGNSSTTKQVMLYFDQLSLQTGGDNLTIFAGNATNSSVLANYTTFDGSVLLISPSNVTKIVLYRGAQANMSATFHVSYNTKECNVDMQGPERVITSPVYLNGTGGFTCTYNVSMATKDTAILSFSNLSLPAGLLLTSWNNLTAVNLTGTDLPDDLFGVKDTTSLTLTLTVQNNSAQQHFSASLHTASPECSGQFSVDPSKPATLLLPSANQWPVTCHAQILAPSKQGTNWKVSVAANTSSFVQGVDSLQYVDGGSRSGLLLGSGIDGLPWHVSQGSKMTVIGSFGATKSMRSPLSYEATTSRDFFPVVLDTESLWVTILNGSWQFKGPDSAQLHLYSDATTALTTGSMVIKDNKLNTVFTFTANTSVTIPVVVPGSLMLVETFNMTNKDKISIHVKATKNDCNTVYTSDSGNINFNFPSGNDTMCNQVFNSDEAMTVQFTMLNLCENTSLEIIVGNQKTPVSLVTLNSSTTTILPMYFKAGSPPRFVWKNSGAASSCGGPQFSAWYLASDNLCGGNITAGNLTSQEITSPWFPNQYPVNSMCEWTVPSYNNSLLYLSLNSIQLGTNDSLQIVNKTAMLNKFNGSQLTDDVIVANKNLSVTFTSKTNNVVSNLKSPGQGISATVYVLSCGGVISNTSSNFTNPATMNVSSQCIWIVNVPRNGTNNSVNILNVTVNMQGFNNSGWSLQIYNGGSLRDPMVKLNTSSSNSFLSRYNKIVVRYMNTTTTAGQLQAPAFKFTLNYTTYSCNKSSQCANGICMHPEWRCNGVNDCGDDSDERNCGCIPVPTTTVAPTPVPQSGDKSSGVRSYWIAIVLFIGIALGVIMMVVVPKIIVKYRARSHNSNSNYGSLHEDA